MRLLFISLCCACMAEDLDMVEMGDRELQFSTLISEGQLKEGVEPSLGASLSVGISADGRNYRVEGCFRGRIDLSNPIETTLHSGCRDRKTRISADGSFRMHFSASVALVLIKGRLSPDGDMLEAEVGPIGHFSLSKCPRKGCECSYRDGCAEFLDTGSDIDTSL